MNERAANTSDNLDDIKARLAAVTTDLEKVAASTANGIHVRTAAGELADMHNRLDALTQQVKAFDAELDDYDKQAERVERFVTRVEESWLFSSSSLKRSLWVWAHLAWLIAIAILLGVVVSPLLRFILR